MCICPVPNKVECLFLWWRTTCSSGLARALCRQCPCCGSVHCRLNHLLPSFLLHKHTPGYCPFTSDNPCFSCFFAVTNSVAVKIHLHPPSESVRVCLCWAPVPEWKHWLTGLVLAQIRQIAPSAFPNWPYQFTFLPAVVGRLAVT